MNVIIPQEEGDADLFAGGGGASEGNATAARLAGLSVGYLAAVNHDPIAIATHRRNHPYARHFTEDIRRVDPVEAMGGRRVRTLLAGVDCTHHSRAKGGKPRDSGMRSLGWDVIRWMRKLAPRQVLVENVPEFTQWGPLDDAGKPARARRGEYFGAFLRSMQAQGYRTDWRVLRACDYGDATSRTRLFVQASRDGGAIHWPDPTHADGGNLFGLPAYRTAREIIDWDVPSESIFARRKQLADTTLARIASGVAHECGEPFLVGIGGPRGRQRVRSVGLPYHTALTECHDYLCQPVIGRLPSDAEARRVDFLLRYNDHGRVQSLDKPITTLDTSNRFALVSAFLISYYGTGHAHSLDKPLPTVTTRDRFALVHVVQGLAAKGLALVDIKLRMLEPHEAAAAQGFPPGYVFEGNRAQRMAQAGQAWPVQTATQVCRAIYTGTREAIQ
jgi:DNA (cytosine-5)-methyltransferase 1